jgi:steroid delta-isomerase-like uncharacterized protein
MANADPRVEVVNEHMRLENAHDFAGAIAAFGRPRYEVMADGTDWDGAQRVDDFLSENKTAFPDFHFDPTSVSPTADAVVVEGRFKGTHEGAWRGLPATGRTVDFPMCLIFEFEGDVMVNERLYFDIGTPLVQLGVADDPNSLKFKIVTVVTHPIAISRAVARTMWRKITFRKG